MRKILITLILLCSCSTSTSAYSSTSSKDIFVTNEIKIEQIFDQNVNNYLVYFYSQHCIHCINLKKTISDFIMNEYYSIFTIEINEEYDPKIDSIELSFGATNYDYVFAGATPQLSLVSDRQVQYSVIGEEDVRIMLNTFIS